MKLKLLATLFRQVCLMSVLLPALMAVSCENGLSDQGNPELVVSFYIPETVLTKAETGLVNPLEAEKRITNLQVWVFLHSEDIDDGAFAAYNNFETDIPSTGLSSDAVTRFSLPLTRTMFQRLNRGDAHVDVYAVANVAQDATVSLHPSPGETTLSNTVLNESTTREELDRVVMTGDSFGAESLTTAFPQAGLPMSGVLHNVPVTGGYPVLNISTLTLVRAVSKIRFVFCQQANPPDLTGQPTPFNKKCVIKSITFDGEDVDNSHECAIAEEEFLFTRHVYPGTQDLFSISGYVPLEASISGSGTAPLIDNEHLTCAEYPERYVYRSPGYETESAQQYENRLDAAIPATSQFGPIYLRETDRRISGTITYRTDDEGEDKTALFSLDEDDVLSRNHSWIVYAYFAEETKTLRLVVVVKPWDYTSYNLDYTTQSVNVIRRFTVLETVPPSFRKEHTADGFFDLSFWHHVTGTDEQSGDEVVKENVLTGDIIIATPVGARLLAIPVPGALAGSSLLENAFIVNVKAPGNIIYPILNPVDGKIEDCRITYTIQCNPAYANSTDESIQRQLKGQYIDLHFCVETTDNRYIDLGSESIDYYRFILDPDWNKSNNGNGQ